MHKETKTKTIAFIIFVVFAFEVLLSLAFACSYHRQVYSRQIDRDNNDKTAKEFRLSLQALIAFNVLLALALIALLYFIVNPHLKGMTVSLIITYLFLVAR